MTDGDSNQSPQRIARLNYLAYLPRQGITTTSQADAMQDGVTNPGEGNGLAAQVWG